MPAGAVPFWGRPGCVWWATVGGGASVTCALTAPHRLQVPGPAPRSSRGIRNLCVDCAAQVAGARPTHPDDDPPRRRTSARAAGARLPTNPQLATGEQGTAGLGAPGWPGRFGPVTEQNFPIAAAPGGGGLGMNDNVYQALLANRIIFLGSEVRDENANAICAQMLLLNAEDPHKDIYLYINSPGGSVDSGMAIFDTMQWISNDVATVAMGLAASMGQFLLSAGTPGKRYALPHSRIMMHQPSGGLGGTASDIRIQAEQSLHIKKTMAELIAKHTGQPLEQIEADSDRDRWFTAEQALEYGFIDHVYERASQINTEAPNQ